MESSSQIVTDSTPIGEVDGSDQWEWEYDSEQTESFYFSIDLTAYDSRAVEAKDRIIPDRSPAVPNNDPNTSSTQEGALASTSDPSNTQSESNDNKISMQILDLHSDNPLIKLGDDLFTCQWMSDLGTQIFISRAGAVGNPLRPGRNVDVVAMSDCRLLAQPLNLRLNQTWRDAMLQSDHHSMPTAADDDSENLQSEYTTSRGLAVPQALITDQATANQAKFLERLSAAKLRKQKSPVVRMSELRRYGLPRNHLEIRRQAQADAVAAGHTRSSKRRKADRPAQNQTGPGGSEQMAPGEASGIGSLRTISSGQAGGEVGTAANGSPGPSDHGSRHLANDSTVMAENESARGDEGRD